MNDLFNVAIMTPVLHYTVGGLQIDPESRVIDGSGKPIPGLFASGEVARGVHGANRLGGSSLLGCVVFGRVSGSAAAYLLQAASAAVQKVGGRLAAVASHVDSKPAATEEKKPQEKVVGGASKQYSTAEVAKHGDCE
jgi:succinate dehydrogenase/fumarate reductase flavoprotein subunit